MGPRSAGVILIAASLALAGCGDDEEPPATSQRTLEQDRQAKLNARDLATAVEACFVDTQGYSGCTAEQVGAARVETATANRFTIVSPSGSGNQFRLIRRNDGTIVRECDEPGEAACPESGSW